MIDWDGFMDDTIGLLTVQIGHEMEARARGEAASAKYASVYLGGTEVERSGDEIRVRVTGLVPNFVERGLGPGGVGTEGAFDIRSNVLRGGRISQSIQVAPGIWRKMTVAGKPWMHPGFRAAKLLPMLAANLSRVLADAAKGTRRFRETP